MLTNLRLRALALRGEVTKEIQLSSSRVHIRTEEFRAADWKGQSTFTYIFVTSED
jgi:hypothetical protein